MPHNLPAEQNLLGALLIDNDIMEKIDDRLRAEHFYDPLHGRIFATMMRMIDRGQLANPVTLKSFFSGTDDGPDGAIEDYLGELADGVISLAQSADYAVTIYEAHLRRELIRIGDDVIEDAIHPDVDLSAYEADRDGRSETIPACRKRRGRSRPSQFRERDGGCGKSWPPLRASRMAACPASAPA